MLFLWTIDHVILFALTIAHSFAREVYIQLCSMRCVFEVCKVPDVLSYGITFISKTDDQYCQRQYAWNKTVNFKYQIAVIQWARGIHENMMETERFDAASTFVRFEAQCGIQLLHKVNNTYTDQDYNLLLS